MKATTVLCLVALALVPGAAAAQTPADNCTPGVPPYTVTSGKPPTITWLMDPTVAASATDPTQVAYFIDGFTFSLDGGGKTEMVPKPTPQTGFICPAGTPNAGKIPYGFTLPTGVAKGNHSVIITVWNFLRTVDPNTGAITVTTQRQEVAATSIPFVVVDAPYTGPPVVPKNIKVIR
jgi:hypothetical protein